MSITKLLIVLAVAALGFAAFPGSADAAIAVPAAATPTVSGTFGAGDFVNSTLGRGIAVAGIGIGLGLILLGAGKGIGAIGSHAVDAIARQPEAGGRIFTSMIIVAALIEGATLFAIVVALIK